jgi:hypothetical protein
LHAKNDIALRFWEVKQYGLPAAIPLFMQIWLYLAFSENIPAKSEQAIGKIAYFGSKRTPFTARR